MNDFEYNDLINDLCKTKREIKYTHKQLLDNDTGTYIYWSWYNENEFDDNKIVKITDDELEKISGFVKEAIKYNIYETREKENNYDD